MYLIQLPKCYLLFELSLKRFISLDSMTWHYSTKWWWDWRLIGFHGFTEDGKIRAKYDTGYLQKIFVSSLHELKLKPFYLNNHLSKILNNSAYLIFSNSLRSSIYFHMTFSLFYEVKSFVFGCLLDVGGNFLAVYKVLQ